MIDDNRPLRTKSQPTRRAADVGAGDENARRSSRIATRVATRVATRDAPRAFRLDSYVVDVLLRDLVGHDRCAAGFLVYLFLWRRTRGERCARVRLSHRDIAEETGLSKSAVQQAMRVLHRRGLVKSKRRHQTDTPEHEISRPWMAQ